MTSERTSMQKKACTCAAAGSVLPAERSAAHNGWR